jgi:hypothetical protein
MFHAKAVQARNADLQDKQKRVEEMFMGFSAHAVPGHDEIMSQQISEEGICDVPTDQIKIIKNVFELVSGGKQTVQADVLGKRLRLAPETSMFIDSVAREPKGVSELPKESFKQVFQRIEA